MDSVATEQKAEGDDRFDTARITPPVDALAEKHQGREDAFRTAMAQLLKAELIASRAAAQTILLKDRHGRRCAERLCHVQDEIIRILYSAATRHLYRSPIPSGAERMAVVATGGFRPRAVGGGNPHRFFFFPPPPPSPPGGEGAR